MADTDPRRVDLHVEHLRDVGPRDLLVVSTPRDAEVSELAVAVAISKAILAHGIQGAPWVVVLPTGFRATLLRHEHHAPGVAVVRRAT